MDVVFEYKNTVKSLYIFLLYKFFSESFIILD